MAREVGIKLHGTESAVKLYVQAHFAKIMGAYEKRRDECTDRWRSGIAHRRAAQPSRLEQILNSPNDPHQFMASIPFPSLDRRTGTLETGLWCKGCPEQGALIRAQACSQGRCLDAADSRKLEKGQRKAYSTQEILEHFKVCAGAKRMCNKLNID
jgi:hypothetical protein